MPTSGRELGEAFLAESKRHMLEESWPRLVNAVPRLDLAGLWHREGEHTNSVGNLLLHLEGNVRQWILSGLGGARDERERSREFTASEPIPGDELLERLGRTLREAAAVIEQLDPEGLLETKRIQGMDVTVLSAILHVVEHLSYHIGQIAHMVKALENVDLGFYEGRNLGATNE